MNVEYLLIIIKMNIFIWSGIIIQENRVLLIKRSKNKGSIPNFWSLPWWKNEIWETSKETAIREVKEEVWLEFEIQSLYCDESTEKAHFYNYIWKASGKIILQEEECDWYWWFTYMEILYLPVLDRVKKLCTRLFEEWKIH